MPTVPFDARQYEGCVAAVDKHYAAWQPIDRAVKATIAHAKTQSPYLAVPALLKAYELADAKAAKRQNGEYPLGSIFTSSTSHEITLALLEIEAATHFPGCVDPQTHIDDSLAYQLPLVGDLELDKVRLCGSPNPEVRTAWRKTRLEAMARFNALNRANRARKAGGAELQVVAFKSSSKELTLSLRAVGDDARCVPNKRYERVGTSWGEQCTWQATGSRSYGAPKTYHFAPQTIPFEVKTGDMVGVHFELDPDAPEGKKEDEVAKRGGWGWLTQLRRGSKQVYRACSTPTASYVQIHSVLQPLRH